MSYVQEQVLKAEDEKLKYYASKANNEAIHLEEDKLLVNLSLAQVAKNIAQTIIAVINELLDPQNRNVQAIIQIFFKEDRMMYIGMTLILIVFSFYIVDITS